MNALRRLGRAALLLAVILGVVVLVTYEVIRAELHQVRQVIADAAAVEASPLVVGACVAAEDPDFFRHSRFYTLSAAVPGSGHASLTMQLVSARLQRRGLSGAVRELLVASIIDIVDTKDAVARAYAANVYLGMPKGEPVYGVRSAAPAYFGVTSDQLTPAQAATLAAAIRNPSVLSPRASSGPAVERRLDVLQAMLDSGVITSSQFKTAKNALPGIHEVP